MKQLFKDLVTCADGESGDVVRFAMVIMILLLPLVMMWGIAMETLLAFEKIKAFDMQGSFNSVMTFCEATGTFLVTACASLFMKKTTEPSNPPGS